MTEEKENKETEKDQNDQDDQGDQMQDNLADSEKPDLEKVKEDLKKVEDQYLRLLADFQNFQKRTAQEKDELYKFASEKTLEALIPALDTFDYARTTVKPESGVDKLIEDFNLVFDTLLKCLKDIGFETIDKTGIPFDPFFHEPLQQIPTSELPPHTIIQILKKGYILNKKVIRPALVSVSIEMNEYVAEGEEEQVKKEEKKHLGDG